MKAPSGDLLFYAAILLGGATYLFIRLPTMATEYQVVTVILAVCVAAQAVLLLVRSGGPRRHSSRSRFFSLAGV